MSSFNKYEHFLCLLNIMRNVNSLIALFYYDRDSFFCMLFRLLLRNQKNKNKNKKQAES